MTVWKRNACECEELRVRALTVPVPALRLSNVGIRRGESSNLRGHKGSIDDGWTEVLFVRGGISHKVRKKRERKHSGPNCSMRQTNLHRAELQQVGHDGAVRVPRVPRHMKSGQTDVRGC